MRSRLSCLAFGVLLLVAASCGTSSGGEAATGSEVAAADASENSREGTDTSAASTTDSGTTGDSGSTTTSDDGEPKTLEEYLGGAANFVRGGGPGGNFDEDQALEQQRLVQQEIQVCMQAQGFVYVPEDTGDGLRFFLQTQQSSLTAAEYAEVEGFGISTRFDAILEGDVDLTETDSPNDEHLTTLSEGEADAWQLALRGAPPERNDAGQLIDPETGEVIQGRGGPGAGGCTGEAQELVRGDFTLLADLAQDFEELEERIAADPRIAEIGRAWTDCMRTEGFDYQDEAEARADINAEFRPMLRTFFQQGRTDDGDEAAQGQGQGRGQGQGNQLQAIAGLTLTAEQDAELEALQDRERALATASVLCQGDTEEEIAEIEAVYEIEFVESNRSALEAISG